MLEICVYLPLCNVILKWSATPTNWHIPPVSTPEFIKNDPKFIHANFHAFFKKRTIFREYKDLRSQNPPLIWEILDAF